MTANLPIAYSKEAEQCVLGSLLLDGYSYDLIADKLRGGHFYFKQHRTIYHAIALRANQGEPFDVLTLADVLKQRGELDDCGGVEYLAVLARDTATSANIAEYAKIVTREYKRREFASLAATLSASAFTVSDVDQAILDAQAALGAIIDAQGKAGFASITDLLPDIIELIDRRHSGDGEPIGLPSGLRPVDNLLGGFQPGRLYIVAGRPSMGKSLFGLQVAVEAAQAYDKAAAIFTLEMPSRELIQRAITAASGIDHSVLQSGQLQDDDWEGLTRAVGMLNGIKLFIDDSARLHIRDMQVRARRLQRASGLDLLVVDYLQLADGDGENKTLQIESISRGLKQLAKELSIPVIALAQLNRGLESRDNKRPLLSDLRGSGALEQDADVVAFLYRDEIYDAESADVGCAEFIVAKNRDGKTGMRPLVFRGDQQRFAELMGPLPSSMQPKKTRQRGFS